MGVRRHAVEFRASQASSESRQVGSEGHHSVLGVGLGSGA